MLNIVFMGTPDFAQKSLQKVAEAGHNILGVVTNPDKPKGRGMKLDISPVKKYAQENNFAIYQPQKIRKNIEFIEKIKDLKPDVICVVAYGKILPQEILDIPKLGCINVHGSLLPKYRGAAPIQWAVLNGETETGITTMYMDAGMDTGDMILKEKVYIGENETTGELWNRLSDMGGNLLVKTLELVEKGIAPREKQIGKFTVAPMLEKEMAKINWKSQNVNQIHNLIRGLNPIMGAYSFLENKKIKFWKSKILNKEEILLLKESEKCKTDEMQPGTVIFSNPKKGLFIQTNGGILQILEIQAENSKKMNINDFLRGNKIENGEIFK